MFLAQSPTHSTGIGGSPFDTNGSADAMGGMAMQHAASGMMMSPGLHTVRGQCMGGIALRTLGVQQFYSNV